MPSETSETEDKRSRYERLMSPEALQAAAGLPPAPQTLSMDPNPTPASAWRSTRAKGFTVQLPSSGNRATIRRTLDLFDRLKPDSDHPVPNPLNRIIMEMIETGNENLKLNEMEPETLIQMMELIDSTVVKMVIAPPVVIPPDDAPMTWQPPEGSISIEDIDLTDRMFLFTVSMGGTTDLGRFREQQEKLLAAVQNGEPLLVSSEPTSGVV